MATGRFLIVPLNENLSGGLTGRTRTLLSAEELYTDHDGVAAIANTTAFEAAYRLIRQNIAQRPDRSTGHEASSSISPEGVVLHPPILILARLREASSHTLDVSKAG